MTDLIFSTSLEICDCVFSLNVWNVKDSTMNRKWCETFVEIQFFFNYDSFLFVRRFQIISSNFLDMQCCSFFASTFRCRHDFCTLFVSKEFDLEWRFCSRYKVFYQFQNVTLNLKNIILDLRATIKRRKRDRISLIVNKLIWINAFSRATSSWFVFFYDQHQLREYRNVIRILIHFRFRHAMNQSFLQFFRHEH